MNHSLHTDYSKPEDQCLDCQKEKKEQLELQAAYDNSRVDQMIEDSKHYHTRR